MRAGKRNGLLIGASIALVVIAINASGINGEKFASWNSAGGIAHNLGYIFGALLTASIIGLSIGAMADLYSRKSQPTVRPLEAGRWDGLERDLALLARNQTASRSNKLRTFGIWFFGVLGSLILGGVIGSKLDSYGLGALWGAIAGICAFSCLRLWLAKPQ